jgi:type VI secretion system protein
VPITLRIKDSSRLLSEPDVLRVLNKGSLTIGRNSTNDMVLPDPKKVISGQHCVITEKNQQYYLKDTSTNGVILNSNESVIGRGNTVHLKDGDIIKIFHFEIHFSLNKESDLSHQSSGFQGKPQPDQPSIPTTETDDQWQLNSNISTLDDILNESDKSEFRLDSDPFLPADDNSQGNSQSNKLYDFETRDTEDFSLPTDDTPSVDDFFNVPQTSPEIPADWEQEWENEKKGDWGLPVNQPADEFQSLEQEKTSIETNQSSPPSPVPEDPFKGSGSTSIDSKSTLIHFLSGAGLKGIDIPEEKIPEFMELLGSIFSEVVEGLMDLLKVRRNIKSELRLKQTMLEPTQNNPLQFLTSAEEAMTMLLTDNRTGYLPPLQAFQKSFENIKAHEVAIFAGMQAALSKSLSHFDPKKIEDEINKEKNLNNLLVSKNTLYWKEFERLYQKIVIEAEDDFHKMFGHEFARAYEEQTKKIN